MFTMNQLHMLRLVFSTILLSVADSPRWMWWYHLVCWLLSLMGVIFILVAHEHYSVDVVVAYFVTSRLFYWYHTMANNQVKCSVMWTWCVYHSGNRECLLILVPQHVQQPGSIKTTNPCPFKSLQGISCNDKCQSRINPSRQTPFSESLIRQCGIMRRYKQTWVKVKTPV